MGMLYSHCVAADRNVECSFRLSLIERWNQSDSLLCVGLDPEPSRIPAHLGTGPQAIGAFCRAIVDATADQVCAFKPQIADFGAHRAEAELERLIAHIHDRHPGVPVILDAKRGDIGATAEQYASEAFERYDADALTVSPYLGWDSIEPYLRHRGKGVFLLCRTSNPGGADLQGLPCPDEPLYCRVARLAAGPWNRGGELGLVVGATFPAEIAAVRRIAPALPLLIPGIGVQGGDIDQTVAAGLDDTGAGIVINSSRAILYAGDDRGFEYAARNAAIRTREAIDRARVRRPVLN